jgi:site-specific recombinase XerD
VRKRKPKLLDLLCDYFEVFMPEIRKLSENTIVSYKCAFELLFGYLESEMGLKPTEVTFKTLDADTVAGYLLWLENGRGCSVATRNLRRTALKSFASYCVNEECLEALKFAKVFKKVTIKKVGEGEPIRYFTPDEIKALLSLPKKSSALGLRDLALMATLYSTGARCDELCTLKMGSVSFAGSPDETRVTVTGKGRRTRTVSIPPGYAEVLREYAASRGLQPNSGRDAAKPVFRTQRSSQISRACIEEVVGKYVSQAKRLHPGMFLQGRTPPTASGTR